MANRYNSLFAKFVAINSTDMVDKKEINANVNNKDKIDPKDKQELITEIKDLIDKDV